MSPIFPPPPNSKRFFTPVIVSAPSKVILHGEHAVVYGMTAVAASLDLRTQITLKTHPTHIVVNFPDIGLSNSWTPQELEELFQHRPTKDVTGAVDHAYLDRIHNFLSVDQSNLTMASTICFLYLYSVMLEDCIVCMEIMAESQIPLGAGLGSSAALSVCLGAGLTGVLQQIKGIDKNIFTNLSSPAKEEVCQWALLSEKILHGTPSGIDNSVSTYGGMLQFSQGVLTPIPVNKSLRILLVNTNVERNTKDLVQKVREKYDLHPKIVKPVIEAIGGISETFLATLEKIDTAGDTPENYRTLEDLIDMNQALLQSLGVSHPDLQTVCDVFSQFGLHAKLTGAGGGGFAYALLNPAVPDKSVALAKDQLELKGFTCCEANIGGKGFNIQLQKSE